MPMPARLRPARPSASPCRPTRRPNRPAAAPADRAAARRSPPMAPPRQSNSRCAPPPARDTPVPAAVPRSPDPKAIEARLREREYRALVVVHNESSTGVAAPLAEIGALLRDRRELLLVDSVSGLGGMEMRMDERGVDVLASASQKCLMCPPGLGIAAISDKAWEVARCDDRMPRYLWDFRRAMGSADKTET